MQVIVDIVLPLFGVLAMGYAAARLGAFDEAANRGLALFVFMFAMPMLLFRALASATLPQQIPWGFMLSYYGGAFVVFAVAMLAGRLLFALGASLSR
jgi:hypothetical protein